MRWFNNGSLEKVRVWGAYRYVLICRVIGYFGSKEGKPRYVSREVDILPVIAKLEKGGAVITLSPLTQWALATAINH